MNYLLALFGRKKTMDQQENQIEQLQAKIKSLQQTIDLQLESSQETFDLIYALNEDIRQLKTENKSLKYKLKNGKTK